MSNTWFNKRNATEILTANGEAWTSSAVDIYDSLEEAGWPSESIEAAIELWLV